jgi:hypothetical protein
VVIASLTPVAIADREIIPLGTAMVLLVLLIHYSAGRGPRDFPSFNPLPDFSCPASRVYPPFWGRSPVDHDGEMTFKMIIILSKGLIPK